MAVVQGTKRPEHMLLVAREEGKHARLRAELQTFFSSENVQAVYSSLVNNVANILAQLQRKRSENAFAAEDGSIEMRFCAHSLIAHVVREVRCDYTVHVRAQHGDVGDALCVQAVAFAHQTSHLQFIMRTGLFH